MLSGLSRLILSACGWQIVGEPPKIDKYVVIIAPHTSNWDFIIFLLLKINYRLTVKFIGKHSIFIGPFGWFLRKIGGIPVIRSEKHDVVKTIVEAFNQHQKMIFALSPEGTRRYRDHWKSGFYHIALKAQVPIQMCFLDKAKKQLGFGPMIHLSGNLKSDLAVIKAFYQDKKGIRESCFSKITFREK